ncbi:MAG TPA: peptide chain release factor N(5)-glutamine methyltransferase [Bdellovibrionota bacterium]
MTVAEILKGIPKKKKEDAVWLLSSLLNCSKSDLILNRSFALAPAQSKKWESWWKRRLKGEPLQYVAGAAPFYGRDFVVNYDVLVPRPETERLVEISLALLSGRKSARLLDIGTGSGAIALSLKLESPALEVVGSDISAAALKVARENMRRLFPDSVRLEKHDLFSKKLARERWDLVVSNPPYLDLKKDKVAADVRAWEPRLALEPLTRKSVKGVSERAAWIAERILQACQKNRPAYTALELSPRIALLLERKWTRQPDVKRIWREADLAGRKRFLLVAWENG